MSKSLSGSLVTNQLTGWTHGTHRDAVQGEKILLIGLLMVNAKMSKFRNTGAVVQDILRKEGVHFQIRETGKMQGML